MKGEHLVSALVILGIAAILGWMWLVVLGVIR